MEHKKVNGVQMRDAETKIEKLLLGFLNSEADRISWGNLNFEVTVKNGKIVHIRSTVETKTLNVGDAA